MNSTHTPGPWLVAPGQRGEGSEAYFEVGSGDVGDLARCYFDPKDNEARGAALADAELMAAAPELTDALHDLLAAATMGLSTKEAEKKADAALRKAGVLP